MLLPARIQARGVVLLLLLVASAVPRAAGSDPGDICGSCLDPSPDMRGVDFRNGDLWAISASGVLYHLSNCAVVEAILVDLQGAIAVGLGHDSARDLFIVTSTTTALVYQVDTSGRVVGIRPSPGPSPVGAAYDPNRDLYWITDSRLSQIIAIDPDLGLPGPVLAAPAGSRIAGTGYDPVTDCLFYHGRDQSRTYVISAATGELQLHFPVPGGGANNGQGVGVAPDGRCWLSHFELPRLFCVEARAMTPVGPSSWGTIRSLYR